LAARRLKIVSYGQLIGPPGSKLQSQTLKVVIKLLIGFFITEISEGLPRYVQFDSEKSCEKSSFCTKVLLIVQSIRLYLPFDNF
jgi:hypothetical protein